MDSSEGVDTHAQTQTRVKFFLCVRRIGFQLTLCLYNTSSMLRLPEDTECTVCASTAEKEPDSAG